MAWPVYSHRFCKVTAPGVWVRYTVPAGHIAVLRNWTVVMRGVAPAEAYCEVGGAQVGYVYFQATNRFENHDFRHVAYGGEQISLLTTVSLVYATAAGYLLQDPANTTRAPGTVELELAERAEPLPGVEAA